MSLQVWLPLNGNLNNQGLSEVTVTNNGATVDSNGKIGSCYSFNTGKYLTVTRPVALTKEISYSCWVNISSWNSASWDCIMTIDTGTAWKDCRATLCRNGSSTNLTWNIANGSSSSLVNSNTSLSLNTWYHIACTYDGTKLRIYVNGVEDNSVDTSLIPNYDSAKLYIGSSNGNIYYLNGFLNDVRIYDHCLSAKEVKEISKGLVCHYKLDNKGFGNPNILVTQSPSQFTRQGNKYTSTIADTRTNDRLELQYFTRSGYDSGFYSGDVSNVPCGIKTTFTVPENISGIRVKFNGASQDIELFSSSQAPVTPGETYTFSIRVLSSKSEVVGGVQVENPKLEKGPVATPWCPHTSDSLYASLGLNLAIEEDCSGLGNNGVIRNQSSISIEGDSPRYSVSTVFNGTPFIIGQKLDGAKSADALSLCAWINPSQVSGGYNIVSSYEGGGAGLHILSGNIYFQIYSNGYTGVSGGSVSVNTWYHIVGTYDNSKLRIYVNGELKGEVSKTGNITYNSSTPWAVAVNPSGTGDGGEHFYGKLSDVRIYSTALSDSDIKELYNVSASVDKNGNMYAYEFKEE